MPEKVIQLERISVHYESHGVGIPLLSLHGLSPDRRLMLGCIEPLFTDRSGWQRFYPDLPGMGSTPAADWIETSDHMLDVVLEFIEAVIPEKSFALVGESYGCQLGRALLHKIPDRVDGFMMICPGIVRNRTLPKHETIIRDSKFMDSLDESDEKKMFEAGSVVINKQVWERTLNEVYSGIAVADQQLVTRIRDSGYPFSFDLESIAQPFCRPTLILTGRQDSMSGYIDQWNFMKNFPRASYVVLDKAGHNLQIEQEVVFNALAREWFERVEADRKSRFGIPDH